MSISYKERWAHPTTADVYGTLDFDHCEWCEDLATGIQAWWHDPNTIEGTYQLDRIGAHILAEYPRPIEAS